VLVPTNYRMSFVVFAQTELAGLTNPIVVRAGLSVLRAVPVVLPASYPAAGLVDLTGLDPGLYLRAVLRGR